MNSLNLFFSILFNLFFGTVDRVVIDMVNPAEYAVFNSLQKIRTQYAVDDFDKYLINISEKYMDISCRPRDTINNIFLINSRSKCSNH